MVNFLLFLCVSSPLLVSGRRDDFWREACPAEAVADLADPSAPSNFPEELVWSGKGCMCDLKPCLRLCCALGERAEGRKCIRDEKIDHVALPEVYRTNLTVDEDVDERRHFHIIHGNPCGRRHGYVLDPEEYEEDKYVLLKNGSIFLPFDNITPIIDIRDFCFYIGNDTEYVARPCSQSNVDHSRVAPYIGTVLSLPFLIVTFLVYILLPELNNLHGLTLRCYVGCLAVSYLILSIDRLAPPEYYSQSVCRFFGYTVHFFFLASFFWLNVMCFDIWWTFGGFKSIRISNNRSSSKKFLLYSIYAWGVTFLFSAIGLLLDFVPGVPKTLIRPEMGTEGCWFYSKTAEAIYFFGPLGITVLCNIYLFISTAIKIIKHERGAAKQLRGVDSKCHDDHKQWFAVYLKLFVVMGVNWSTEFISWAWTAPDYIWIVTDTLNALQGLLIFVILVLKKKIKNSLVKRFNEAFNRGGVTATSKDSAGNGSQDSRMSTATNMTDSDSVHAEPSATKDIPLSDLATKNSKTDAT